jgi:hypothetical protein
MTYNQYGEDTMLQDELFHDFQFLGALAAQKEPSLLDDTLFGATDNLPKSTPRQLPLMSQGSSPNQYHEPNDPLESDYKALRLESNLDALNSELAAMGNKIEDLKALLKKHPL